MATRPGLLNRVELFVGGNSSQAKHGGRRHLHAFVPRPGLRREIIPPTTLADEIKRAFFGRIGRPIIPIWLGILLLTNYAVFKLVGSYYPSGSELRHAANELKESTSAVIFAWTARVVLQRERSSGNESVSQGGERLDRHSE